eukprot:TRINITY_DN3956_c0_g1_i2.p1 TRINITY_DN3956_c0_g1~~TRINITY_DN3956_c0_g1_i2.p1  ORF type:complete len:339 (+),score=72.50 TRINITY_DN3956_c0_g1_i2:53-1069(+)
MSQLADSNRAKARRILDEAVTIERELGKYSGKPENDETVVRLREELRSLLEQLILTDYDFAASRDVELLLWRSIFYKRIEAYRGMMRKAAAATTVKAQSSLAHLTQQFFALVSEASAYYQTFIHKLEVTYDMQLEPLVTQPPRIVASEAEQRFRCGCYRCLLFLGDLARYRELHSSRAKDFSDASRYYLNAIKLAPEQGNAHNQLAVLATYQEDEAAAVFYYLRSLSATKPFTTAKENLTLLFEKNRKRYNSNVDNDQTVQASDPVRLLALGLSAVVRFHGAVQLNDPPQIVSAIMDRIMLYVHPLVHMGELPHHRLLEVITISMMTIDFVMNETGTV